MTKYAFVAGMSLLLLAGCHTRPQPAKEHFITFDMLPPDMQAKGRALYGPQVSQEWLNIVRRTIKAQPWVACYCDIDRPGHPCNPTNWSCCGSAVFQPQDASSCSIPVPCNCPPPPQLPK
ncbi:MAG TPA: hypothetical protein VG323_20865 [Thermoanaerobaculia bacterium]|nr:hypothetical protein [Thermoanaerobaculia bacterium]